MEKVAFWNVGMATWLGCAKGAKRRWVEKGKVRERRGKKETG